MANCMICNVEFDPAAGTSKNFCPVHCAPVPGMPIGGAKSSPNQKAAIVIGVVMVLFVAVPLALGHYWGAFFLILITSPVLVAMFAVAAGRAAPPAAHASAAMICPHCRTRGTVRTMPIRRKVGISGAKATGAILTGGVSLLATGLSRKESATQAHCSQCSATWFF
jgi:hypothetical protein